MNAEAKRAAHSCTCARPANVLKPSQGYQMFALSKAGIKWKSGKKTANILHSVCTSGTSEQETANILKRFCPSFSAIAAECIRQAAGEIDSYPGESRGRGQWSHVPRRPGIPLRPRGPWGPSLPSGPGMPGSKYFEHKFEAKLSVMIPLWEVSHGAFLILPWINPTK